MLQEYGLYVFGSKEQLGTIGNVMSVDKLKHELFLFSLVVNMCVSPVS